MKKILTLIFLFLVGTAQAQEVVHKVVYDLTTSDLKLFERTILQGIVANKTHYENNLGELEVAVVIHGGAYKFFVKDLNTTKYKGDVQLTTENESLKKRIRTMSETYDVAFLMCGAGMKNNKLEKNQILDFVKVVPNASIGLIDKQNEGFAYIPVRD